MIKTTLSKPVSVSIENMTPAPPRSDAHHALDADRQRDLHMVEALGPPIADGAIGKERGVAAAAGIQKRCLAADIEIALLLSGKACVGQVFGRGAGANSHIYIYVFFVRSILHVFAPAQLAIG